MALVPRSNDQNRKKEQRKALAPRKRVDDHIARKRQERGLN